LLHYAFFILTPNRQSLPGGSGDSEGEVRMSNTNSTITVNNQRGQAVGYIRHGGIFHRKFDPSKHILRFPVPSLCLEVGIVAQLKAANVESLWFEGSDGVSYKTSLAHFCEAATKENRGYGEQMALPLTGFTVKRTGEAVSQLNLWDTARVRTFGV
jgi:hypothetical protein